MQVIPHPGNIWSVAFMPCDDLITGSSDAVVRVWTQAQQRRAPPEAAAALQLVMQVSPPPPPPAPPPPQPQPLCLCLSPLLPRGSFALRRVAVIA